MLEKRCSEDKTESLMKMCRFLPMQLKIHLPGNSIKNSFIVGKKTLNMPARV